MPEDAEFTAEEFAADHRRIGAAMTDLIADYVSTLDEAPVCSTATRPS